MKRPRTAKRGAMVEPRAEWLVKKSRVDVTPESAGLSPHVHASFVVGRS
jgi:hypothetical protein